PIYAAPGQLLTLYVYGIPKPMVARAPVDSDLPTTLAGVAGTMGAIGARSGGIEVWGLPLLEVGWVHTVRAPTALQCYTPTAAVTLQLPYGPATPGELCRDCYTGGHITLTFDGEGNVPYEIEIQTDQVHILKMFDSILPIVKLQNAAQCSPL